MLKKGIFNLNLIENKPINFVVLLIFVILFYLFIYLKKYHYYILRFNKTLLRVVHIKINVSLFKQFKNKKIVYNLTFFIKFILDLLLIDFSIKLKKN